MGGRGEVLVKGTSINSYAFELSHRDINVHTQQKGVQFLMLRLKDPRFLNPEEFPILGTKRTEPTAR